MKKQTLGYVLLLVYGAITVLLFLVYSFSFISAIIRATYLIQYIPQFPSIIAFLATYLTGTGAYVLLFFFQAVVLYFGGNWLEKLLKRK